MARPHHWVVAVTYRLTDEQAAAMSKPPLPGQPHKLTMDMAEQVVGPGCYVCEQHYATAVGKPCPGEPR